MIRKCLITSFVLEILMVILFLTGCKDMVEIEDRDFVLALGITTQNEEFKLMYARPDLGALTGQNAKENESFIRTVSADSFTKAEAKYSLESNKRLDYSHLKVILLDHSLTENRNKMIEFLNCIEKNYEISRNTLVFMTFDGVDKVIERNDVLSGSIGEYLESLNKNNLQRKGQKSRTIGDLINCMNYKDKTAVVPIIEMKENGITINGVGLFSNNIFMEKISSEDYIYYDIANGHGEDSNIRTPSGNYFKLTKINRKCHFSMQKGKPYLLFQINGNTNFIESTTMVDAITLEKNKNYYENELNSSIKDRLIDNFYILMKEKQIDFLNLYRMTSYNNKKIWEIYQGKQKEFINDLEIGVVVDIKINLK